MKILLFSHLEQIQEHAAYIHALKKVGPVQTLLLTMGQEESELGQKLGTFDAVKDMLPEQVDIDAQDENPARTTDALNKLEERIGSRFINQDILMDRYFRGQPRLDVAPHTVPLTWTGPRTKHFMYLISKRLEEEILRFDPDFVFVETSSAPSRMAWRLAREKGVPAGVFMSVRFWPNRLYLETGIGYEWHQARAAYDEMKTTPMTGAELTAVKQRLQTIRDEKTKPAYLKSDHAKGLPSLFRKLDPRQRLEGLDLWLGQRARTFTRHPRVLPGDLFSPFAQFGRYLKGLRNKRYLRAHQTPISEIRAKKYAVYFLHVQPELTVEEMAFDYQEQVNTLRNILAALPADMYLVVKEHTPMLGYRPVDVYSKLVHMPGVIIADTQADSHELIAQAQVVVTLTGTVALEAVLYGVPAIVLGSIYFENFVGICKPDNLNKLKKLLSNPERLTRATEDDALRMLGSLHRASSLGMPARVDVALQKIDAQSAKSMMTELKSVAKATLRS